MTTYFQRSKGLQRLINASGRREPKSGCDSNSTRGNSTGVRSESVASEI
jgi:hypothetical protein